MKKLKALLITLTLVLTIFAQTANAAEIKNSTLDLAAYLSEVSTTRGFEVSEGVIDLSLLLYGKSLSDFKTAEEIKAFLGEAIKSDLSNLVEVYSKYALDEAAATKLLNEYGEDFNDYVFVNDLDEAFAFYTSGGEVEQEADFDIKLASYLTEISNIRGITITVEDINEYLSDYYLNTKDVASITELKELLGDVINVDLSNLDTFETDYNMDISAILQLLSENGKSIDEFIFMDQLEVYLWEANGNIPGIDMSAYMDLLNQMGVTQDEIKKLENYLASLDEYLNSDGVQAKLEDLSARLMTFGAYLIENSSDENFVPSEEDIAEMVSVLEELLTTMKLKLVFTISKDGIDTQYTMSDLLAMTVAEELDFTDADFTIAYYSDADELLFDMVITSDFVKSNMGEVIEDISDVIDQEDTTATNEAVKTVKGGELPKTSSNRISYALLGMLLSFIGIAILQKARTERSEGFEK